MRTTKSLSILAIFLSLLAAQGCSSDVPPPRLATTQKLGLPEATGKANQILVVADSALWKGAVGDSFFYYFSAPFLLLPQPEPIFDVVHMTPEQLQVQQLPRGARTIVFLADLDDVKGITAKLVRKDLGPDKLGEIQAGKGYSVVVGQDKWAQSQLVLYVAGYGGKKLVENIVHNFPAIAGKINEKDLELLKAAAYAAGESAELTEEIKEKFGLSLKVPADFKKAKYADDTHTLWLHRDQGGIVANILLTKIPYTDQAQLTKAGLKALRDKAVSIASDQPGSAMHIHDAELPLFVEEKTINQLSTLQAKGVWRTDDKKQEGPFVSNLMLNPSTKELVLVDAFLYSPKMGRREFMQEMEIILSTAASQ